MQAISLTIAFSDLHELVHAGYRRGRHLDFGVHVETLREEILLGVHDHLPGEVIMISDKTLLWDGLNIKNF